MLGYQLVPEDELDNKEVAESLGGGVYAVSTSDISPLALCDNCGGYGGEECLQGECYYCIYLDEDGPEEIELCEPCYLAYAKAQGYF